MTVISDRKPPLPFSATIFTLANVHSRARTEDLTDAALRRVRLGGNLDIVHAGGLRDLVVDGADGVSMSDVAHVALDVADRAVKVGRVDVPLVVFAVRPSTVISVDISADNAEAKKVSGALDSRAVIVLCCLLAPRWVRRWKETYITN